LRCAAKIVEKSGSSAILASSKTIATCWRMTRAQSSDGESNPDFRYPRLARGAVPDGSKRAVRRIIL
jgi:hypothetical protein